MLPVSSSLTVRLAFQKTIHAYNNYQASLLDTHSSKGQEIAVYKKLFKDNVYSPRVLLVTYVLT